MRQCFVPGVATPTQARHVPVSVRASGGTLEHLRAELVAGEHGDGLELLAVLRARDDDLVAQLAGVAHAVADDDRPVLVEDGARRAGPVLGARAGRGGGDRVSHGPGSGSDVVSDVLMDVTMPVSSACHIGRPGTPGAADPLPLRRR